MEVWIVRIGMETEEGSVAKERDEGRGEEGKVWRRWPHNGAGDGGAY